MVLDMLNSELLVGLDIAWSLHPQKEGEGYIGGKVVFDSEYIVLTQGQTCIQKVCWLEFLVCLFVLDYAVRGNWALRAVKHKQSKNLFFGQSERFGFPVDNFEGDGFFFQLTQPLKPADLYVKRNGGGLEEFSAQGVP